jgi:Calx-beta domain/IPT/TIG domain
VSAGLVASPAGAITTPTLTVNGTLTGTVLRFDDLPAVGSVVTVATADSATSMPVDADGRFVFVDLPADTYTLKILPPEDDDLVGSVPNQVVTLHEGQTLDLPATRIPKGASVSGFITGATAQLIAAVIDVEVIDVPAGPDDFVDVLPSSDGTFTVSRLTAGTYLICPVMDNAAGGESPCQPPFSLAAGQQLSGVEIHVVQIREPLTVTATSPTVLVPGGWHTLVTVTGTGFTPGVVASFDVDAIKVVKTTFVSHTQLVLTVDTWRGAVGSRPVLDIEDPATFGLAFCWCVTIAPIPVVTVRDAATTVEGGPPASFRVDLSSPEPFPVFVDWSTSDGTATAPGDYTAAHGRLEIFPGETWRQVDVPVRADSVNEYAESFHLTLSNPSSATLGAKVTGTGWIKDNSPQPTVSVANASAPEGSPLLFKLQLSAASGKAVVVQYATVAGTAKAGVDYVSRTGSVTIPAGSTTAMVAVSTVKDGVADAGETMSLALSSPLNVVIAEGTATGTIT